MHLGLHYYVSTSMTRTQRPLSQASQKDVKTTQTSSTQVVTQKSQALAKSSGSSTSRRAGSPLIMETGHGKEEFVWKEPYEIDSGSDDDDFVSSALNEALNVDYQSGSSAGPSKPKKPDTSRKRKKALERMERDVIGKEKMDDVVGAIAAKQRRIDEFADRKLAIQEKQVKMKAYESRMKLSLQTIELLKLSKEEALEMIAKINSLLH